MTIVLIVVLVAIVILLILAGFSTAVLITGGEVEKLKQLKPDQYVCSSMTWMEGPEISERVFSGTIAFSCDVEGLSGGGLKQLADHLKARVPEQASLVHNQEVKDVAGTPTIFYDVTMPVEDKERKTWVRGHAYAATDNLSYVQHVFTPTEFEGLANKYVRQMKNELLVTEKLDKPRWYTVQSKTHASIKKPLMIPPGKFKEILSTKIEKELDSRKLEVATSVANHL